MSTAATGTAGLPAGADATSHRAVPCRAYVRLGARTLALEDVRGYRIEVCRDRDRAGSAMTIAVASAAALVFLVGVVENGWRARFWMAVGVCGLIGLSALQDVLTATPINTYRVDVDLAGGGHVHYVTADAAEAAGLDALLRQAAGRGGAGTRQPQ